MTAPAPIAEMCSHFGECGGCAHQDWAYPRQLEEKARTLAGYLEAVGWTAPVPVRPSPDVWHYRNKVEFSFGRVRPDGGSPEGGTLHGVSGIPCQRQGTKGAPEARDAGGPGSASPALHVPGPQVPVPVGAPQPAGLVLGFKKRKRWDYTLNMRECRIFSPRAGALLEAARTWAGRESLPAYDSKTHSGFLRHLVLREGKNTGQMMVILVAAAGGLSPEAVEGLQKSFAEAALEACPGATVLWGENAKLADTAVSDTLKTLSGPGYIEERMGDLVFRISPHSFFQTNSRGAQELYAVLRGWVEDSAARRVLDLYCGGGGISLTLARSVEKVVGVEIHPDAVADARRNALLNGIANAEFYPEKAEAFLNFGSMARFFPGESAGGGQDWTAVFDPPRSGLHPGVLKALLAIRPRFLIYVSCNPKLLPADLKALSQCYKMDKIEAFDLFPHTDHFEAALQLSLL